ncbi:MAG: hypothetical protein DI598_20005 [Pseudopedobacter saltans]|uniref:Helix-turn-helix domain-containing protein n=1 Tax=Pseudopedobacter saltans TaxID=151895 RepID=A0A2W5G7T6_9SPHI|nr:MAG: hypothetical protein DI598_20005 [Pseudopedobacter saltans]
MKVKTCFENQQIKKVPMLVNLTKMSEYLKISRRTLYNMISDGRFSVPAVKGTKPRLWNMSEVEEWRKKYVEE